MVVVAARPPSMMKPTGSYSVRLSHSAIPVLRSLS